MTTTPAPLPTEAERRLNASIDYWKRNLLDLTHRNRALNFKPARVSTVVIVDEQPAEVFRELCLKRGSMKFKPAPEPEPPADAASGTQPVAAGEPAGGSAAPPIAATAPLAAASPIPPDVAVPAPLAAASQPAVEAPTDQTALTATPEPAPAAPPRPAGLATDPAPPTISEAAADLLLDEADTGPALDFVPYDRQKLDTHQTDDALQTSAPPEQLDRSLRRIDEQARLALEEQGVNSLFLALGMLHYRGSKDSQRGLPGPIGAGAGLAHAQVGPHRLRAARHRRRPAG